MTPRFVVADDLEALSEAAARHLIASAQSAVARAGRCAIALAGGETPRRLYQRLAGDLRAEFPWSAATWWWSDERCVPPDAPESNYRLARETLLDPAAVPAERAHRIEGEMRPIERAARAYEDALGAEIPGGALDVILLGVGADGHTASLFPSSPELDERTHWVVATEAPPEVPVRERITFTFPLIERAREVMVMASGASKRAVVAAVRAESDQALAYPVARLTATGALTWFVDRAAAGAA